jgi:muramoyltetrapeptide carboxypeptidase LdcA involved in peptidoglycan recycling
MLRTQKPPQLRPGDTVAAISLSWGGPATFPHRYQAGKQQFEQAFGVRVVETRHALRDADWLARNPQARADDLMEAFSDPALHGIISTIGGDDSIRILRHLDLNVLRDHPKVFVGYSDTTVSHFACLAAGLTSFYGPAFMGGFGENAGIFPYLAESFRRTVFSAAAPGVIEPSAAWTVEHLPWAEPELQARPRALRPSSGWRWSGKGRVRGPLIGGCIEVMEWLKGVPVWPQPDVWDGAVLFLETSEEAPPASEVRRWLRNYGAQGILDRVAAVLLGRPGGAELALEDHALYEAVLVEVVRDELGLSLPLVTGMDFGHTDPFFTLPYGVMAELDCDAQRFALIEPACSARES